MSYVYSLVAGILIGLSLAVPPGPVNAVIAAESVKKSYVNGIKVGLAMGDAFWGILRSSDGQRATYYFRGTAVNEPAAAEHSRGDPSGAATRSRQVILLRIALSAGPPWPGGP